MAVTVLQETFSNGLAPDKRVMANSKYLARAYGQKVSEFGCVPFEEIIAASTYDGPEDDDWPFPQIFKLETDTIVLGQTGLYRRGEAGLEEIPVYQRTGDGTEVLTDGAAPTATNWTLTNLTAADGNVSKTSSGSIGTLVQAVGKQASPIVDGDLYTVKVTVASVEVEGQIRVTVSGNSSEWVNVGTGTYAFEVLAGSGDNGVTIEFGTAIQCVVSAVSCENIPEYVMDFAAGAKPFHAASFRKVFILTNGSTTFFCSSSNGSDANSPMGWRTIAWNADTYDEGNTKIGCVENLNGRLYMSGFDPGSAHFDSDDWAGLWETWIQFHTIETTYESLAINSGTVFYSRGGSGDYWWPLAIEMALFGVPDEASFTDALPFLFDSFRKRDIGFFHPTYGGDTMRVVKLGDKLIMYGTNGICAAVPMETEDGISHSVVKISDVGLLDVGAVTVLPGAHIFLDGFSRNWVLNANLELQLLKYDDTFEGEGGFLENVDTDPVVICYDIANSDIYFSNGVKSYMRSRTGLSEEKSAFTSVANLDGTEYGYWKVLDADTTVYLRTETLDFGERMLKSIHDAEIGRYDITNMYMRVWYRTVGSSGWRMSEWILCLDGGFAVPLIEGHDIQLEFKYEPGANARFEYVKINWQRRDLRNFRAHQFRQI